MIQAILLAGVTAATSSLGTTITCAFPEAEGHSSPVMVDIVARTEPASAPSNSAATLIVDRDTLLAKVTSIPATIASDVMLRAIRTDGVLYSLGILEDGRAALNIRSLIDPTHHHETRLGHCTNTKDPFTKWLPS